MFALRDTVCELASIPRLDDNPRDFCLATVRAIPISLETSDPCREIVLSLSLLLLSSTVRKRFETRYSLLDRRVDRRVFLSTYTRSTIPLLRIIGVASIPDCKDQRASYEWNCWSTTIRKMDVAKSGTEDFVTVVSVESVHHPHPQENFVTVLSIGSRKEEEEEEAARLPLEEEVEVYRLPGERLGFGLKFEGGNKTSERVRRLFVQSCAEQSPASRARCSWGTLGEGDEVLSIDGVPVTHMTRLDCVRRLKESQLVIKLMVRCRGALRPEVVSAEKKTCPERDKMPPELPSAPPPVPPRKLRLARGLADGEANPNPAKRSWNAARANSQNASPDHSPTTAAEASKSTSYESCESSPRSGSSPKGSPPKERSPELAKSGVKQEPPPEAMVYVDARSQCGSTHGSTSDDTGSSMSTVIDRFSSSDRVSTISTASTASTASEQPGDFSRIDQDFERSSKPPATSAICPFEGVDDYYASNPPDYLLRRLASSEAVTHVESRGEVEKITAVVAPNTVLIEETITFQPPLSFQDAPLSYGHEARPDLFYTADLAADSTTHFRPIKDDVELVERVNSAPDSSDRTPPPLPARNHVNRITTSFENEDENENEDQLCLETIAADQLEEASLARACLENGRAREEKEEDGGLNGVEERRNEETDDTESMENYEVGEGYRTNKVLEIIEIRKARAFPPRRGANVSPSSEKNEEKRLLGEAEGTKEDDFCQPEEAGGMESDEEQVTKFNEPVDELEQGGGKEVGREREGEESEGSFRSCADLTSANRGGEEAVVEDDTTSEESDEGDYYWQSNLATIGEEEETNSLEYANPNKEAGESEAIEAQGKTERQDSAGKEDAFDANARNDEVDDANRSANFPSSEPPVENHHSETVNGRMDNCGGGQRLPPDGDEFPAAYQEFGGNSGQQQQQQQQQPQQQQQQQQQHRFATTGSATARTSTMMGNGRLVSCNEGESFMVNEGYKLLEGNVVTGSGIILQTENRIVAGLVPGAESSPVCQEVVGKLEMAGIEVMGGKVGSENVVVRCQDAGSNGGVSLLARDEAKDDSAKKRVYSAAGCYGGQGDGSSGNVLVSEKRIEITGYYHKDVVATSVIEEDRHAEKDDTPPPLPLTGPPKIDRPTPSYAARNAPTLDTTTPRKFTLNGELWRQDDKSERSVRDKIAMFSSQSSLDGPLFPSASVIAAAATSRRLLSKYKSTEDVCSEERMQCGQKERISFLGDRTQSSFDLTDSGRSVGQDAGKRYNRQRSPSAATAPFNAFINAQKTFPQRGNATVTGSPFEASPIPKSSAKSYVSSAGQSCPPMKAGVAASAALSRATSFSGSPYGHQDRTTTGGDPAPTLAIARTNSLASTFKRPAEDSLRRNSLNQLIEQRKRSISKLRGLVIPEKETITIDAPIVDLPEIKSRDSILLHQVLPKMSIQDKWGSQSSLASNASTASVPLRSAASFKMPAPQIHSKYSPAFKRKSLTVYGTSSSNSCSTAAVKTASPVATVISTPPLCEPPKSLESICSPTRSDYSFEYASAASSPEGLRGNRPRAAQRKARMDYDDSDNDSAVSSSQSSISRGFSPPASPVPSERSTISSERSYLSTENNYQRRSLIIDSPTRGYNQARESDGSQRNGSQIPQRQLKRSNSTDTNCSTSSTLTSGSQASAESLSRRVLKPQSVEAINRKNILASARCRSGRDLNGSPLIQRKFADDKGRSMIGENGEENGYQKSRGKNSVSSAKDVVKIAYIEVTDPLGEEDPFQKASERSDSPLKTSVVAPPSSNNVARPSKFEASIEPSNDLKMWVRAEAKALARSIEEKPVDKVEKKPADIAAADPVDNTDQRRNSNKSVVMEKQQRYGSIDLSSPSRRGQENENPESRLTKQPSRCLPPKKSSEDQNDLLTILTTKSRSRSAIHVDEGSFATLEKSRLGENSADEMMEVEKSKSTLSKIPMSRNLGRRSVSVTDMKKAVEVNFTGAQTQNVGTGHNRFPSLDSSVDENVSPDMDTDRCCSEQFGSISSLASSTSLISQQELAQLVEEASLEETRGVHDVIVVLLHKENPTGSVGITLAGGADCEIKEITIHRVLAHSIADKDGRVQRGDRILSINGRSTQGLTHRESIAVLKQPRSEVVLVVSRSRTEEGSCKLKSRTASVETIIEDFVLEGFETNDTAEDTAWGPPSVVAVYKDGTGLGFSLEGGRDSPLGNRPLLIKKIFTGGAAEKTGALKAGDQLLQVNGYDVTRMSRIEAWSLMKKLHDGEVNLLVRHPATKSS
ncbi:hypothetical protein HZU67_03369 [Apis mellifera carnica]|nr:hypothetical protein HZU67_03369 [Apis mellifera carnica]